MTQAQAIEITHEFLTEQGYGLGAHGASLTKEGEAFVIVPYFTRAKLKKARDRIPKEFKGLSVRAKVYTTKPSTPYGSS
ncbi:MAG: hypothetical protein NUV56_02890 [Candidatus Uhrbacteria bacterium]|nr:hypothetical protein [Candidatus Uhrbacteria bacterium]